MTVINGCYNLIRCTISFSIHCHDQNNELIDLKRLDTPDLQQDPADISHGNNKNNDQENYKNNDT